MGAGIAATEQCRKEQATKHICVEHSACTAAGTCNFNCSSWSCLKPSSACCQFPACTKEEAHVVELHLLAQLLPVAGQLGVVAAQAQLRELRAGHLVAAARALPPPFGPCADTAHSGATQHRPHSLSAAQLVPVLHNICRTNHRQTHSDGITMQPGC